MLNTERHDWQDPDDLQFMRDQHSSLMGYLRSAQNAGVLQTLLVT